MNTNAAENLSGRTLANGWYVESLVKKPAGATGGFFSVCYSVTRGAERGFLKAYSFDRFFNLANSQGQTRSVVDVLSDMLESYRYERDLSELCRQNHVTKVAFVKESGEEQVAGFPITVVPYLVFDSADGDVRAHLAFSTQLDEAWKLRSLHSVAVGLEQLHRIDVSHQDLKPSNILIFEGESKIGDLGRSTCLSIKSALMDIPFSGDHSYAPPEVLYGVVDADWRRRSFACDSYLLGSLIIFYFSGLTATALLRKNMPDSVSWEQHRGSYDDVRAYVDDAFAKALDEFSGCVVSPGLGDELGRIVRCLCNPDPACRSYPRAAKHSPQFSLERVITRLNLLHRKARFGLPV
jgi:serine/threonine protein kinase